MVAVRIDGPDRVEHLHRMVRIQARMTFEVVPRLR